jgi:type IV pilus assembly protein PilC
MVRDIESGMRFSQAMSRQPETFPSSYRRVVETGEQTGRLGDTLARLAVTLDRQTQTTRRIKGALVYPACLLASSLLLVAGMLYFVFPMLIHVTEDAGVEPPALTRLLIVLASKKMAVCLLLGLAVGAVLLKQLWNHPRWGPPWQRFVEENTPPGRFLTRARLLACIRQLAMMLESGVDLLRSIQYSGNVGEASLLLSEAFEDVYQRVKFGESMTQCMSRHEVFPRALTGMVSVAEEVGDAHVSLYRFCDMFEDNLNNQLDSATALIEPVLMASMGLVIGLILVAAFLPIYNLVSL